MRLIRCRARSRVEGSAHCLGLHQPHQQGLAGRGLEQVAHLAQHALLGGADGLAAQGLLGVQRDRHGRQVQAPGGRIAPQQRCGGIASPAQQQRAQRVQEGQVGLALPVLLHAATAHQGQAGLPQAGPPQDSPARALLPMPASPVIRAELARAGQGALELLVEPAQLVLAADEGLAGRGGLRERRRVTVTMRSRRGDAGPRVSAVCGRGACGAARGRNATTELQKNDNERPPVESSFPRSGRAGPGLSRARARRDLGAWRGPPGPPRGLSRLSDRERGRGRQVRGLRLRAGGCLPLRPGSLLCAATRSWSRSARAAWAWSSRLTTACSTRRGRQGPAAGRRAAEGDGQPLPLRDQAGPEGPPPQRLRDPRVRRGRPDPYIAMEYVEGPTSERRAEGGAFPGAGLRRGAAGADGLGAIHEAGVIHRDLKPANIMGDRAGGAPDGLRHRQGLGRPGPGRPDRCRPPGRLARVHEPGAGSRQTGRLPQRPVRPRRGAVRDLHRPRALARRDPCGHDAAAPRGRATPGRAAGRPPAGRARARTSEGSGEGPARALRRLPRHAGRAARRARGGPAATGHGRPAGARGVARSCPRRAAAGHSAPAQAGRCSCSCPPWSGP